MAWAAEVVRLESEAVRGLEGNFTSDFPEVVNAILSSKGRLVITGIGKSAAIANKIVATLNSTGTPAIFMHAADAVHGDLGMILRDDVVLCISKSGNTPEIKALIPLIKNGGNTLIGMVGNLSSFLAQQSDFVLNVSVDKEACPNNLAPTTSTTTQLVMGDVLAVCLLKQRGFTSEDFARYHPGGSLGKRLYTTLGDIAGQNAKPEVTEDASLKDVIFAMTRDRLGAVAVVKNNSVVGIVTDGDIRRMLSKHDMLDAVSAADIMTSSPFTMDWDTLAIDGSKEMRERKISQIVITKNDHYAGMVHIHDLNKEGILL